MTQSQLYKQKELDRKRLAKHVYLSKRITSISFLIQPTIYFKCLRYMHTLTILRIILESFLEMFDPLGLKSVEVFNNLQLPSLTRLHVYLTRLHV